MQCVGFREVVPASTRRRGLVLGTLLLASRSMAQEPDECERVAQGVIERPTLSVVGETSVTASAGADASSSCNQSTVDPGRVWKSLASPRTDARMVAI